LNKTAAFVWQQCDGRTTTQQIARSLSLELHSDVDHKLVWFALRQLDRHHLLEQHLDPQSGLFAVSRREALRALGVGAAVTLPVVASILAPTPAQAATGCKGTGATCSSGIECCSGVCSGGSCAPP
jgi:hypothetical protein